MQQEARGRALDGEETRVERLLDRSADLTDRAAADPDVEPRWVYFQTPERAVHQQGVAYLELGRYADAVNVIESALACLPATYRRDHGRYRATLALAAAHGDEVERAAAAAHDALAIGVESGSDGTLATLRRARDVLDHRAAHPAVRTLDPALRET